jgi:hypothetical protein
LETLSRNSEIVFLPNIVDKNEGVTSVRRSAKSEDIDSKDIGGEVEVSGVGVRGTDSVCVD